MPVRARITAVFALITAALPVSMPSCGHSDTSVEFHLALGYSFSSVERSGIERVTEEAAADARRALPTLPHGIVLKVQASHDVIPETGEAGQVFQPNIIWWDVDPRTEGGVPAIIDRRLRASLFHSFHHLVREQTQKDRGFVDTFVSEGLATAFERDFAHSRPPWGVYGDDVKVLTRQVLAIGDEASWTDWLARDRQRRRWAGQRVGTYVVDTAMRASQRNAAQMVAVSADEILRLAQVR